MIGTLVNTGAVIVGSSIGLLIKQALPKRYETIYFQAVGLFTIVLGIKMSLAMAAPLPVVLSLVIGGFTGLLFRLDERVEHLGDSLKKSIHSKNERFTEGLTTGLLLFCMGSMTIVGCIEEGFGATSDLLLTKSVMDFFSSIMLAAAMGLGILFSAIAVLVFQGGITLLVSVIGAGIPENIISEIGVAGGIILLGLGLNLLDIKNIKVINLLPALLYVGLFIWLKSLF
ncbi:MAG: DUF554 domain-containing protein [Bacteroidales bacterium]|jgi:uncharacterized membrane protein YqgA involved in biofilm formation|nr:DUF554 domain-containing protein [Bacteroidales bacterium]